MFLQDGSGQRCSLGPASTQQHTYHAGHTYSLITLVNRMQNTLAFEVCLAYCMEARTNGGLLAMSIHPVTAAFSGAVWSFLSQLLRCFAPCMVLQTISMNLHQPAWSPSLSLLVRKSKTASAISKKYVFWSDPLISPVVSAKLYDLVYDFCREESQI